jgi:hypothetical protein
MKIQFTFHALQRMEERQIFLQEVIRAVRFPDKKKKREGTNISLKIRRNRKLLITIWKNVNGKCRIITVIETSKLKKYL